MFVQTIRLRTAAIGAVVVIAAACGTEPASPDGDGARTDTHTLALAPQSASAASTVKGRVVAVENDGRFREIGPVAGAAVAVTQLRPPQTGEVADTIGLARGTRYGDVSTDTDGRFTLTNVPDGYLLFTVALPSGVSYRTLQGGYLGFSGGSGRDHVIFVWKE